MRRGNSDSFGAVDELRAWCCYCNKIYSFIHLKLFLYFCPLTFRVILYRRCYLLLSEAPRLTASRKSIYLLHNINHVSSNKSLPHSFGDISITALCTHLRVYLWYLHSQFHRELWNVQRFFIKYLYHLGGGCCGVGWMELLALLCMWWCIDALWWFRRVQPQSDSNQWIWDKFVTWRHRDYFTFMYYRCSEYSCTECSVITLKS